VADLPKCFSVFRFSLCHTQDPVLRVSVRVPPPRPDFSLGNPCPWLVARFFCSPIFVPRWSFRFPLRIFTPTRVFLVGRPRRAPSFPVRFSPSRSSSPVTGLAPKRACQSLSTALVPARFCFDPSLLARSLLLARRDSVLDLLASRARARLSVSVPVVCSAPGQVLFRAIRASDFLLVP
jgi:hypothetical protein